jgi:hypothetical protein
MNVRLMLGGLLFRCCLAIAFGALCCYCTRVLCFVGGFWIFHFGQRVRIERQTRNAPTCSFYQGMVITNGSISGLKKRLPSVLSGGVASLSVLLSLAYSAYGISLVHYHLLHHGGINKEVFE